MIVSNYTSIIFIPYDCVFACLLARIYSEPRCSMFSYIRDRRPNRVDYLLFYCVRHADNATNNFISKTIVFTLTAMINNAIVWINAIWIHIDGMSMNRRSSSSIGINLNWSVAGDSCIFQWNGKAQAGHMNIIHSLVPTRDEMPSNLYNAHCTCRLRRLFWYSLPSVYLPFPLFVPLSKNATQILPIFTIYLRRCPLKDFLIFSFRNWVFSVTTSWVHFAITRISQKFKIGL